MMGGVFVTSVAEVVVEQLFLWDKIDRHAHWWLKLAVLLVQLLVYAGVTVWSAFDGAWIMSVFFGVGTAIVGYQLEEHWKRRPPRKRPRESIFARIVDLGHRLAVQPSTALG